MARTHSKPKYVLLLALVASLLALLVGLVGFSQRGASRPRTLSWVEPAGQPRQPQPLRTPVDLPPLKPGASHEAEEKAAPVVAEPPNETRQERARLVGLVLRPQGTPASEARVVLGQQHARCNAEGRFEILLPPDVGEADLIAFEPGYEPTLRPGFGGTLAMGNENFVQLFLGPETLSLAGTVQTADGSPLKGWTVELDGVDPLEPFGLRERIRTDGNGRFLLPDVPTGVWVVRAWKDGPDKAVRSTAAAAGEGGIVIVVDLQ